MQSYRDELKIFFETLEKKGPSPVSGDDALAADGAGVAGGAAGQDGVGRDGNGLRPLQVCSAQR